MAIRQVVLIQPRRDGRYFGRGTSEPYTLMRLASLVPQEIPVEIWDEDLMDLPIHTLGKQDLVGISAKTLLIDRAKLITQAIQRQGATVVVGGTHTTLVPDEVEQWADSIAVGEAYTTWPQIIKDFDRGTLQKAYVDESWAPLDSGVAVLQDRVLQQVNEHKNYWTPYLEITRGCPRNCTFCTAIRVSGRTMRLRPVEEVVEEIERRKISRFFLTDDNFGLNFKLNPEYMESLMRALAKLPLKGWTCQAEQMVADFPEMLTLAREAHMDKFFIGFESVNPANRKELGGKAKGNIERYRQVIKTVHAHGIGVVGLFVFGFDHDTFDTFQQTWDFVRSSELDSVSATVLTPYPGTEQRQALLAAGRIIPHNTWERYDTTHVTYVPKLMTVDELTKSYDWLCRKLYSPPVMVQRGLRQLLRHPVPKWPKRAIAAFSTDIGYRREFGYRYS
ncbi:MAG: radical SAM protein [Caldilineales bacterium]|mgnify:CR=1 FL=1